MKRRLKLIALVISSLMVLGIVGVNLAQAGSGSPKQTNQQMQTDEANEAGSSEVEDADEPGDDDGPGQEQEDD